MLTDDPIANLELDRPPSKRTDPRARKLHMTADDAAEGHLGPAMILLHDADALAAEPSIQEHWRVCDAGDASLAGFDPPPGVLTIFKDELPGPLAFADLSLAQAVELAACESVEQIEPRGKYEPA